MAWRKLTESEAKQHPLYGFGGWLATLCALSVCCLLYATIILSAGWGRSDGWTRLGMIAWTLIYLPFLILGPRLHPNLPAAAAVCAWINPFIVLVTGFRVIISVKAPSLAFLAPMEAFVGGLIFAIVFQWYLVRSKRVNVTYRHRVRMTANAAA